MKNLVFMHPRCSESKMQVDDCGVDYDTRVLWYRARDDFFYMPLENIVYFSFNEDKEK